MFFKPFPLVDYEFKQDGIKTAITDIFRYIHVQREFLDDANGYKFYQIHNGERPDVVSYKLYGTPDYYWTFFIVNELLHTGMSAWPLSSDEFNSYMDIEYNGVVINGIPKIIIDSDGLLLDHRDSVSGRFEIGEQVLGTISEATGTIVDKNSRYNNITIENVVGTFKTTEIIQGQTSHDFITSHQVFDRKLAPKYYLDANGLIVDNSLFIIGGTPDPQTTYTNNLEWETNLNDTRSAIRVVRPEFIEDFVLNYRRLLNGRN